MQPVVSFGRVFLVCGIGSFFVLCPALPVPLVRCKSTLCRTAGEGVRRMQSSRKNSKRKRHFVPFFLLPYGVTAENQPFNDSLANDLLIDIKTNLLYYRMIILYIAIILAIIGRFCL